MMTHYLTTWLAAILIALLMSAAMHLDDAPDARAEWAQSAALADAIKSEAAQARFDRAAAALCGSENAVAKDLGGGVIQCLTHKGTKTKRVAL